MQRVAVVVGVDKVDALPVLSAAASGAVDFAAWARQRGFAVTLITDQNGKSVDARAISQAIKKHVDSRTVEQLVVFFSGHGILKGPLEEYWLLSEAGSNPNEAVNVSGSIALARKSEIPHVIFVSDACRSAPLLGPLSQVSGANLFPSKGLFGKVKAVDQFYATLPGDPSYEVAPTQAASNHRALFTSCLLEGLTGKVPETIERRPAPPDFVITSDLLGKYLAKAVPAAAAQVSIQLVQDPEVRSESHPPLYFIDVPGGAAPPPPPPPAAAPTTLAPLAPTPGAPPGASSRSQPTLTSHTQAAMNRVLATRGRESFETGNGFTVVGTRVIAAAVLEGSCNVFQEGGHDHVRVDAGGRASTTAALVFEDGSSTALAVFAGMIGTVLVEDGRIVHIAYGPSRLSPEYAEYDAAGRELDQRRAYAAALARTGTFRLSPEEARFGASYLRALKSIDPALGIYAAYAYAQIGDYESVKSVERYMVSEGGRVPFDVAMLAGTLEARSRVAPFCPMLSQGWSLIDALGVVLPRSLRGLARYLRPSLWLTVAPEGTAQLLAAVSPPTLRVRQPSRSQKTKRREPPRSIGGPSGWGGGGSHAKKAAKRVKKAAKKKAAKKKVAKKVARKRVAKKKAVKRRAGRRGR